MMRVKKQKKSRSIYIVICGVLVVIIALLMRSCGLEGQPLQVTEYEENVDQITEIDYSEQQEALNALVDEGKMNVNYSSKATFRGAVSERFNIKNIKNNHYPIIFELFDEDGECIYVSKKIEPGYEMNSIELKKELSEGEHACKIKVGYAEEGNVSSVFPITIEVK